MPCRGLHGGEAATAVVIIMVTAATGSSSASGVLVDGSNVVGGANAGVGGVLAGIGAAGAGGNGNAGAGGDAGVNHFQTSPGIMDSSRVSTCLISMLLIVYGSFRSLNIEQEAREREQKKRNESMSNLLTGESVEQEQSIFYLQLLRNVLNLLDKFSVFRIFR